MADRTARTPTDWSEIARLMRAHTRRLPPEWDYGNEFLLTYVRDLAKLIVWLGRRGAPLDHGSTLLCVGAILFAQARKQAEAAELQTDLLEQLRGGPHHG